MRACAREECVAELTAALPGERLGFCVDHFENRAAYIGSWLRILREDNRFLFTAAAHAQRAMDYLVEAFAKGSAVSADAVAA